MLNQSNSMTLQVKISMFFIKKTSIIPLKSIIKRQ